MKRMMMTVVATVVCLTISAEKNVVMPTMGCEEQTVVKMLGTALPPIFYIFEHRCRVLFHVIIGYSLFVL